MIDCVRLLLQLKRDRRAVTALEYGLIAAVLVGTVTIGFSRLAANLSTKFSGIGASL